MTGRMENIRDIFKMDDRGRVELTYVKEKVGLRNFSAESREGGEAEVIRVGEKGSSKGRKVIKLMMKDCLMACGRKDRKESWERIVELKYERVLRGEGICT